MRPGLTPRARFSTKGGPMGRAHRRRQEAEACAATAPALAELAPAVAGPERARRGGA